MISKLFVALIGAALGLPAYAQTQQSRPRPDPADPAVVVPPTVYESVIAGASPAPPGAHTTPDKSWRAANDAVGAVAGHAGHAAPTGEARLHGHGAAPARPRAPAAAPAKPADPAAADHSEHH